MTTRLIHWSGLSSMAKFNSAFADTAKGYNPKDYVPLEERDDWDGKIEVLPTCFDFEARVTNLPGKARRKKRERVKRNMTPKRTAF